MLKLYDMSLYMDASMVEVDSYAQVKYSIAFYLRKKYNPHTITTLLHACIQISFSISSFGNI